MEAGDQVAVGEGRRVAEHLATFELGERRDRGCEAIHELRGGLLPAAGTVRIHVVGRLSALVGDVENLWMSVQLGWKVVDNPYCGDVRWGPMILESRRGSTIRV